MTHFQHGITCGRCGKRLLPGGTDDQRPREVLIGQKNAWENGHQPPPVFELMCRACSLDAARGGEG